MTPTGDKICDSFEFRSPAFVTPDDYHYLTEWRGAIKGSSSENPNSMKDMKMSSIELQNYSNKLKTILEIPRPLAFIQESESGMSCKEKENTDSVNDKSVDYVAVRKVSLYNSESSKSQLDAPSSSMKSNESDTKRDMQNDESQLSAKPLTQLTNCQTKNAVELLTKIPSPQDVDTIRYPVTKTQKSMTDRLSDNCTNSVSNDFPQEHHGNDCIDYIAPSQAFTKQLSNSPKSLDIPENEVVRNDLNPCSSESKTLVSLSSRGAKGKVLESFDGYVTSVVNPNSQVPVSQMPCGILLTANAVEQDSSEASTFNPFLSEVSSEHISIPKTKLCNNRFDYDPTQNHSFSSDIQERTISISIKYPENSDMGFQSGVEETDSSYSGSDKIETNLRQASCSHDHSGFQADIDLQHGGVHTSRSHSRSAPSLQGDSDYVPCIGLQSCVAKTNSSHSGLAPFAHDNSGYVSTDKVENSVHLSATGGYVPHCSIKNVSHKVDEHDSKETVSTFNNFEVNSAFVPPENDCSAYSCNEEQTDVDNVDSNLQNISACTYQLNRYSPRHFIYPTPDAYVLSSQKDMQLTDIEGKKEDTSQGYVDETFAKGPSEEIKNVLNKSITLESQNDGYVDQAALKIFNGQNR